MEHGDFFEAHPNTHTRRYEHNKALHDARQINGDVNVRYEKVDELYQSSFQHVFQPQAAIARGSYFSPSRWLEEAKNNSAIIDACKNGQVRRLENLLLLPDKTVDYMDKDGMGALHWAARNGHTATVRVLLERSVADPGLQLVDWTNATPLIVAAEAGHTELLGVLLDHGAAIDTIQMLPYKEGGMQGTNALAEAILNGHLTAIELLVSRGADVNINLGPFVDDGATLDPFALALLTGDVYIVEMLIGYVSSPGRPLLFPCRLLHEEYKNYRPFSGRIGPGYWSVPALEFAILRGSGIEVLRCLLASDSWDSGAEKAFHLATLLEDLDMMQQLEIETDVDCVVQGKTALHLAALFGKTRGMQHLIQMGADREILEAGAQPNYNRQPSYMTNMYHTEFVIALKTKEVTVKVPIVHKQFCVPQDDGSSPLHAAVRSPQATRLLLERVADANPVNEYNGFTPLHTTALLLEPDTARILIFYGASREFEDRWGRTPFDLAMAQVGRDDDERQRKTQILDVLRPKGPRARLIDAKNGPSDGLTLEQVDWDWDGGRATPMSPNKPPRGSNQDTSSSSWAHSENYSSGSWALSETYSSSSSRKRRRAPLTSDT